MTFRELFANSAMRPYLVRRARGLQQGPPSQVCLTNTPARTLLVPHCTLSRVSGPATRMVVVEAEVYALRGQSRVMGTARVARARHLKAAASLAHTATRSAVGSDTRWQSA